MSRTKIGGMPPARPSGGKNFRNWEGIAKQLAENPGVPVLVSEFTQTKSVESIQIQVNYAASPPKPLRELGGKVTAYIRNSTQTLEGGRIGDLWLLWEPEASNG